MICEDEVPSLDFEVFLTLEGIFKVRTGERDLLGDSCVFIVGLSRQKISS